MLPGIDFFRAIERFADRPALFEQGRWISYAELVAAADDFAARLEPGRGLAFLHCANDAASIAAYLGCLRAGYVVFLHGEADERRLGTLASRYAPQVICTPDNGGVRIERRSEAPAMLHPDLRVLLSTSGSTGTPKLVMLSEANLTSNAAAICSYIGITEQDRAVTSLKFHYSYGMSVINTHLGSGAGLVLTDEAVSSPGFWTLAADTGATSFAGVPYTFELLASSDGWARTPGLRYVTQAGGRLPPETVRRIAGLGRENGWSFFVMYGQTEAAPRMAWLPPEMAEDHPDCIGKAIPGGQLDVVDADGRPIDGAEVAGELAYSGPNVMMGYAMSAADLAAERQPSRLMTGDLAVRTRDGLFRIVGRTARMVKPFGLRVNLDEVEEIARAHVAGAVCTGTDERIVVAYPYTGIAPPLSAAGDIARTLGLPPYAVQLVRMSAIPMLASGKPDYPAILAEASASTARTRERGWLPAAWDTIRSPRLYSRALSEAAAIVGLARLPQEGVRSIFATMTGRQPASDHDDFRALAGDSLSFVQTSLALEDYLGFLPDGWETMPIADLEAARRNESVL